MNLIKLKIKAKHLAVEPRIIRETTKHLPGHIRSTVFRQHNIDVIRPESRATQLAIAYIKGKPYSTVEKSRKPEKEHEFIYKVLPRVLTMVQKYHDRKTSKSDIEKWINGE